MAKGKKVAPAPKVAQKKEKKDWKQSHSHLFSKDPRDFRIGRDIQPKRDVSRFVKWPRYVRLQRQRAILKKRLKVPPAINQFAHTLDKNQAENLFRLLMHYRPETHKEKAKRLRETAKEEVKNAEKDKKEDKKDDKKKSDKKDDKKMAGFSSETKPIFLKYGINHITRLVESKKAKLIVIAHDVDPIELVLWLPALCRKLEVPYCIVKSKSRLGQLVDKKTSSVVALTEVRKEDQQKLDQIVAVVKGAFNDNVSDTKKWGGGKMGMKTEAVISRREKVLQRENKTKP